MIDSGRRPVQNAMSGIDPKYRFNDVAIKQENRFSPDSFVQVSGGMSIIAA